MNKELPQASPCLGERLRPLCRGDPCSGHSCLQGFPELLYIMERRRFKFLGEILEPAGCWARGGQRKEGHPAILPPAPDCGVAKRNLRI